MDPSTEMRVKCEGTPEARLAAVAKGVVDRMTRTEGRLPDYADFRDEFRKQLALEILLARIDEAKKRIGPGRVKRLAELHRELAEIEL